MVDYRIKVFDYLKDNKPWDVLNVVFAATDQAQHLFWGAMEKLKKNQNPSPQEVKFGNVIFDIYKKIDAALDKWLDGLDEDTVLFIMSDHGAGPIKGVIYLNNFLAEHRFLSFKNKGGKFTAHSFISSCISKSLHTGKSVFPQRIRSALKRKLAPLRDSIESYMVFSDIDWERTKAFSFGCLGSIRINLKKREPFGIINVGGEYEGTRNEIIEDILSLKNPETNENLVERVYKREDLYKGPYVHKAPDLIIHWKDYEYDSKQRYGKNRDKIFDSGFTMDLTDIPYTASHRLNGLFMAYGKSICKVNTIYPKIEDIAPTVLYLQGVPIPETMDGRVLIELFGKDIDKNQIVYTSEKDQQKKGGKGYNEEEETAIKEKLKSLGYLG
jgi:predicted AlkP superfamily phosphohydrolase/phosphomutase